MSLIGILPVNKPCGVRSTECVEKIRRILGRRCKVGHGGTLDSTASGLLLLLIGSATRLSGFIMSMPKTYETVLQLGTETETDDASGEVLEQKPFAGVTDQAVDAALPGFLGWRMQTPPAVSAAHVDGERAHRLARAGQTPNLQPKPVFFRGVKRLGSIDANGQVAFHIDCGKGTYIRSFARDLGRKLGCGAHVSSLHRSRSGSFSAEGAKRFDELLAMRYEELEKEIVPLGFLGGYANTYRIPHARLKALQNGMSQDLRKIERQSFGKNRSDLFVIMDEGIFAVCDARAEGGTLMLQPVANIFYDGKTEA